MSQYVLHLPPGKRVPKAQRNRMNLLIADRHTVIQVVHGIGSWTGVVNLLCKRHVDKERFFFERIPGRPDPTPPWRS